jgi:flagellar assembly protein FliH
MTGMNASTRRTVIHDREFQSSEKGYLVDNASWQEEIRRRASMSSAWTAPVFEEMGGASEAPVLEPARLDPKAAFEEAIEKARREAAELTERALQEARERAEGEAQAILDAARQEADRLKAEATAKAQQEKEELLRTAAQEGRAQGLETGKGEGLALGRSEGLREYQAKILAWDNLFKSAADQRHTALDDMDSLLVDLVGDALHRCLRREAQERPAMVVEMVRMVLQKAHDRVRLRVHLSPEDISLVEAAKGELQLSVGAGSIELVPDGRVEKGGCLLETEAGSVDARLGVLASQAQEALKSGM